MTTLDTSQDAFAADWRDWHAHARGACSPIRTASSP